MKENKSSDEQIQAFPAEDIEIVEIDYVDKPQKDIPLTKIIELKRKNLSLQQIADICKCSKQNIWQRLQDCEEFEEFSRDTAVHYEVLQHRIISSIDDADIKKTPMTQRVVAVGILEDKKRIIRGQATERIDTFALTAELSAVEKRIKELEEKKTGKLT